MREMAEVVAGENRRGVEYVWEGAIPIQLHLHDSEVTTLPPPPLVMVYGPSSYYESKIDFFPSIANSLSQSIAMKSQESNAAIQHEIWRVARAIQRAADALRADLS